MNKCSQLIGMDVKNPQGEKLGDIQDVVIDFTEGKVAYCVLSTGGGILTQEKLHAVPLRAFQASSDGNHLILNADKDKLSKAEGFSKEVWPSPSNPAWGAEPFWTDKGSTYKSPGTRNTPTTQPPQPGTRPTTPPEDK
jgi:sporulation protein YlmC with PRC-barrel domain